ncbi:MAG: hypothetical protein BWY90_01465 [Deltaproteobacteria bacterium ADurb.BinA014]|nr:MAG: hypothetical protein BWY90_01465 [Deltaproteobacteria bacterium ADurb.BinA014]
MTVDRLSLAQIAVEFGFHVYGADLGAITASRTFIEIHIARRAGHFNFEFARFAFNRFDGSARQNFHVGVTADFHEFGR